MDWQHDRIGAALRGENPTVLARLPGGFAVFGDVQWLPGWTAADHRASPQHDVIRGMIEDELIRRGGSPPVR